MNNNRTPAQMQAEAEDATRAEIRKVMRDLMAESQPGDSVTVLMSGHETCPTDVDGIAGPTTTEIEIEDPGSDSESDRDTDDFDDEVAETPSQPEASDKFAEWMKPKKSGVHVLSFFDICNAGNVLNFSQNAPPHGAGGATQIGTDGNPESAYLATPSQGTDGPLALD